MKRRYFYTRPDGRQIEVVPDPEMPDEYAAGANEDGTMTIVNFKTGEIKTCRWDEEEPEE